MSELERSVVTVDLGAIRANATRLRALLDGAELWAVVKADGYGHGALDVALAALEGGATALCVASVGEALELRASLPEARVIVMGATDARELATARNARLELVAVGESVPDGIPVHVKLDTGMGRWGLSELKSPSRNVIGLMTHFACADSDRPFTERQLASFLAATAPFAHLTRHAAASAAALMLPTSRLDAARCGIALYGIDPLGEDATRHGLRPALGWRSTITQVKQLQPGQSTGYGRRFVAPAPTWIGLVPVGYADGFRRDMTGSEVLIDGERRRVVGTISMDVLAVALAGPLEIGTPVTLIGEGVTIEQHAAVAGTIGYEIACGIRSGAPRARRKVGR